MRGGGVRRKKGGGERDKEEEGQRRGAIGRGAAPSGRGEASSAGGRRHRAEGRRHRAGDGAIGQRRGVIGRGTTPSGREARRHRGGRPRHRSEARRHGQRRGVIGRGAAPSGRGGASSGGEPRHRAERRGVIGRGAACIWAEAGRHRAGGGVSGRGGASSGGGGAFGQWRGAIGGGAAPSGRGEASSGEGRRHRARGGVIGRGAGNGQVSASLRRQGPSKPSWGSTGEGATRTALRRASRFWPSRSTGRGEPEHAAAESREKCARSAKPAAWRRGRRVGARERKARPRRGAAARAGRSGSAGRRRGRTRLAGAPWRSRSRPPRRAGRRPVRGARRGGERRAGRGAARGRDVGDPARALARQALEHVGSVQGAAVEPRGGDEAGREAVLHRERLSARSGIARDVRRALRVVQEPDPVALAAGGVLRRPAGSATTPGAHHRAAGLGDDHVAVQPDDDPHPVLRVERRRRGPRDRPRRRGKRTVKASVTTPPIRVSVPRAAPAPPTVSVGPERRG